jgi:hypothetical protein
MSINTKKIINYNNSIDKSTNQLLEEMLSRFQWNYVWLNPLPGPEKLENFKGFFALHDIDDKNLANQPVNEFKLFYKDSMLHALMEKENKTRISLWATEHQLQGDFEDKVLKYLFDGSPALPADLIASRQEILIRVDQSNSNKQAGLNTGIGCAYGVREKLSVALFYENNNLKCWFIDEKGGENE